MLDGRWQDAQNLLDRRHLIPIRYPASLEVNWLEAELAAQRGDYAAAVRAGSSVLEAYSQYGTYGPGSGRVAYWEMVFRRTALWIDTVPQAAGMQFPARQQQLLEWAGQPSNIFKIGSFLVLTALSRPFQSRFPVFIK
jgi:hypothetical protein